MNVMLLAYGGYTCSYDSAWYIANQLYHFIVAVYIIGSKETMMHGWIILRQKTIRGANAPLIFSKVDQENFEFGGSDGQYGGFPFENTLPVVRVLG